MLCCFFLVTTCWCGGSFAQLANGQMNNGKNYPERLKFTLYSKKDGLQHPQGQNIFEDSRGFIWIWNGGLSRFDGHSFKNFPLYDTLSRNGIQTPASDYKPDHRGRLWGVKGNHMYQYDPYSDRFVKLSIRDTSCHFVGISNLHFDERSNKFWIMDEKGICIFDPDKKTIKRILRHRFGYCFQTVEDRQGNLILLGEDSLHVLNMRTRIFRSVKSRATMAYVDNQKQVWLGQWGHEHQLLHFDTRSMKYTSLGNPYGGESAFMTKVPALTGDTILWVGMMEAGIGLFNTKNRRWIHNYSMQDLASMGLPETRVKFVFTDSRGILWFHSQYYLAKLDPANQQFLSFVYPNLNTEYNINQMLPDRLKPQRVWFNIDHDGIIEYDLDKKKVVSRLRQKDEKWNAVTKLKYGPDGKLWACSRGGLGEIFRGKFIKRMMPGDKPTFITQIAFDEKGGMYVATLNRGIWRWSEKTNEQKRIETGGISRIADILPDGNLLWLATSEGLIKMDIHTHQYKTYKIYDNHQNWAGKSFRTSDLSNMKQFNGVDKRPVRQMVVAGQQWRSSTLFIDNKRL